MEKLHTTGKENLFEAVNCSPILSSGSVVKENRKENFVYSPLSELNPVCQGNRLYSPRVCNTSKVGLLLSTPVQQPSNSLPDSWEEIRKLDEEELWIERTQVVTQEDHLLYSEIAKDVINDIIENLPILNMEESNAQCNNTVVESDANKHEDLVNGLDTHTDQKEIEIVHNGNAVDDICEERIENVTTDMKDVAIGNIMDNENSHSSTDQALDKSGMEEDNDAIFSCSDLDTTVKEVPQNHELSLENTLSEDKDAEDLDETVKEITADELASSANILPDNKELLDPESTDDINLQFDEGSFKPAAVFGLELDFLESCGNSGTTEHVSDLARQSLYVKFDPLVEARKPEQVNQETSGFSNINPSDLIFEGSISGDDLLGMDTPPEKPVVSRRALLAQAQNETEESTAASTVAPVDLFELSPSKNVTIAEKAEEESSKSETSIVVPEEESSLVQNEIAWRVRQSKKSSGVSHNAKIELLNRRKPLQYSKKDLDNAVEKAVEEEKEKLLSQWNLQNSLHEAEMEKLLDERNRLLEEKDKILDENKVVKTLMMEYEQTMAQMIKDRENEQSQQEKSNSEIIQERDQLQRDLNNTEKSFAHLHEKFGKLKNAVESYRKNEEVLKKVVKDLQEDVKNADTKYQVLKSHAEQKLQEANVEINRVQSTYKTELAGIQAAFKREKTKNSSLQQSLDQKKEFIKVIWNPEKFVKNEALAKVHENKELTAICDELISKVGPVP